MDRQKEKDILKTSVEKEVDIPITKLYTDKDMLEYMLNNLGMSAHDIARSFKVTGVTVYRYISMYNLSIKKHGLQKGRKKAS